MFSEVVITKINMVCQEAKEFIEKDEPIEVEYHYSTHTSQEIAEKYREIINYYNKLQHHIKNVEYIIYVLIDTQNEIDRNRPTSDKKITGITKYVDVLKNLLSALKGMDRGMYHTLKYYEKIMS